jgi:hypothetical protein
MTCESEVFSAVTLTPHWLVAASTIGFFLLSALWKLVVRSCKRCCCGDSAEPNQLPLLPQPSASPSPAPASAAASVNVNAHSSAESWQSFLLRMDVRFLALQLAFHSAHFLYICITSPAELDAAPAFHRFAHVFLRLFNSGLPTLLGVLLSTRHFANNTASASGSAAAAAATSASSPSADQSVSAKSTLSDKAFDSETVSVCGCSCASLRLLNTLLLFTIALTLPGVLVFVAPMILGPYIWIWVLVILRRMQVARAGRGELSSVGFVVVRLLYSYYYAAVCCADHRCTDTLSC